MAKIEFARDKIRSKFSSLLEEFEAMFVFLAKMNSTVKKEFDSERKSLALANKRELQDAVKDLSARLMRLRRSTGATQPIGYYSSAIRHHTKEQQFVFTLPVYVAVGLFSKYPGIATGLKKNLFPLHALIELDQLGRYNPQKDIQLWVLEAMLFEDMCSFWNESCSISISDDPYSDKRSRKRLYALHRAAVSSAFYMVEAFCNGLGMEIFLTRRHELKDHELQIVTDWDEKKSRPRFVSLRDKLLQYPKLLLEATEPPVQESNSADLGYFLSSAKDLRDSIVHANPALGSGSLASTKLKTFSSLDHDKCGMVVDSSIAVVDRIATAIDRKSAAFWLQPRREDGLFDESVFD